MDDELNSNRKAAVDDEKGCVKKIGGGGDLGGGDGEGWRQRQAEKDGGGGDRGG